MKIKMKVKEKMFFFVFLKGDIQGMGCSTLKKKRKNQKIKINTRAAKPSISWRLHAQEEAA